MTHSTIESFASIDDVLGPASGRFFGLGYRLTDPRLRDLVVRHDAGSSTLHAAADVTTGDIWSQKGDSRQLPHLSTVDLLVIALESAQVLLASRLSPRILAASFVETITIRSGSQPVEGALVDLPVKAVTQPADDARLTSFTVTVSVFQVELSVRSPDDPTGFANCSDSSSAALIGHSADRVYGDLYKARSPLVTAVEILGPELATARAALPTAGRRQAASLRGIEADFQPGLTLVDAFVVTLQLGQVLLYRLDAIERAASETLWMRRTTITVARTPTPHHDEEVSVALERSRVVSMGGAPWRMADVVGRFGERLAVSCTVAHRIPVAGSVVEVTA
jgi:hypothetical protein